MFHTHMFAVCVPAGVVAIVDLKHRVFGRVNLNCFNMQLTELSMKNEFLLGRMDSRLCVIHLQYPRVCEISECVEQFLSTYGDTHSHTHIDLHTHTHTDPHTYTHTDLHTHTGDDICTSMDVHAGDDIHTHNDSDTHTHTHTRPHTYTDKHSDTHTDIHRLAAEFIKQECVGIKMKVVFQHHNPVAKERYTAFGLSHDIKQTYMWATAEERSRGFSRLLLFSKSSVYDNSQSDCLLRVDTSKCGGFKQVIWPFNRSSLLAITQRMGSIIAFTQSKQPDLWHRFLHNFEQLYKNREYVEREDEFDDLLWKSEDTKAQIQEELVRHINTHFRNVESDGTVDLPVMNESFSDIWFNCDYFIDAQRYPLYSIDTYLTKRKEQHTHRHTQPTHNSAKHTHTHIINRRTKFVKHTQTGEYTHTHTEGYTHTREKPHTYTTELCVPQTSHTYTLFQHTVKRGIDLLAE